MRSALLLSLFLANTVYAEGVSPNAIKFRPVLTRVAHYAQGLDAPIPLYAAQVEQESSWKPDVTAWDNGRGLAQFMDPTADFISKLHPELGKPQPYNPEWALQALVRYDGWLFDRVKGQDTCHKWGAALKGYNGGLGYVQRAQRKSQYPEQWWEVTEYVPTGQGQKNFEYSRMYPHWIIDKRQPKYHGWGTYVCDQTLKD